MRLATFVQISDLHIGLVDPGSLDARTQVWKRLPWLDGLLGHSYASLQRLHTFFSLLREREPEAYLIITGDLTAMGHPQEFETANEYLGAVLRPPKGKYIGLEVAKWGEHAIPGNHDHWPGTPRILGGPTPALSYYFPEPKVPKVQPLFRLSTGHDLRFLRINTDADVDPLEPERVLARGMFRSQLESLSNSLEKPGPKEIRALCLHHSRTYDGFTLKIDTDSRQLLDDFIVKHQIAVLLCGHIHEPPSVRFLYGPKGRSSSGGVLEGRSGTTAQLDRSLLHKLRLLGFRARRWENSLLVHRILGSEHELLWEIEVYLESRKRFERADSLRSDIQATTTVHIWPPPVRLL
jgi:3',5'-cyclic AMP phosphodiesterase CpdA